MDFLLGEKLKMQEEKLLAALESMEGGRLLKYTPEGTAAKEYAKAAAEGIFEAGGVAEVREIFGEDIGTEKVIETLLEKAKENEIMKSLPEREFAQQREKSDFALDFASRAAVAKEETSEALMAEWEKMRREMGFEGAKSEASSGQMQKISDFFRRQSRLYDGGFIRY